MNETVEFQTPAWVGDIMVSLIEGNPTTFLEPTPGEGNLIAAIKRRYPHAEILAPKRFELCEISPVDWVIMNPPFRPTQLGYDILKRCFGFSGNIIALMPWVALINGEKRTNDYLEKGLKEVWHLPRIAFPGARVQTCILKFCQGYYGEISLKFAKKRGRL